MRWTWKIFRAPFLMYIVYNYKIYLTFKFNYLIVIKRDDIHFSRQCTSKKFVMV